ncbi:hypothetical protein DFH09DRAFT_1085863 [Mycena vulgaris]|nr:hypothetical protein DFH09DRAFT_1085863 [Mycena vulgaris]
MFVKRNTDKQRVFLFHRTHLRSFIALGALPPNVAHIVFLSAKWHMPHPPFKLLSLVYMNTMPSWPGHVSFTREEHLRISDLRGSSGPSTEGWWVADDMRVIFDWGLGSSVVGSSRLEPIE